MTAERDIWTALEEAPPYAEGVSDLYHWSTNYQAGEGPFTLFLDLIGWSDEEFGMNLYSMPFSQGLGYVEIGKLAKALDEYSDRPGDVRDYVDELMRIEGAA